MSSLSSHSTFGVGDTRRSSIKSLAKMKINVSTVEQFLNVAQGIGDDNLAIRNEIYDACKEARSSIKLIDHLRQLASKQNQQQNQFIQSTRLSQLHQARQQPPPPPPPQLQHHVQHSQVSQASGIAHRQQHHHYYQQQLSLNQQQQFSYSNRLALIRASKSLVSSIGKILFLTDSIVVKQMLQCKDRNSIALSRLENVANYSELLRAFGLMSYELVDLGQCLLMFQFMSLPANHQQQIAATNHHQQAMMAVASMEAGCLVDRRRFSHNNRQIMQANNIDNNKNWANEISSESASTIQHGRSNFWHHNKPASHTKAKLKLTEQLQDMQTLFAVNRVIIDRSIILLLSAAKACLRHPDCDKARETRDSVLLQIKASMSIIMAIIKQSVFSDQMQPAAAQQQQRYVSQPLRQLDTNIVHTNHYQQQQPSLMSQLVKRYADHHNNQQQQQQLHHQSAMFMSTASNNPTNNKQSDSLDQCNNNSVGQLEQAKNSSPLLPYPMSLLDFQNNHNAATGSGNSGQNNSNNNIKTTGVNEQRPLLCNQQQQQQQASSIQYCALQILNWFLSGPNNISTVHVAISELQLLIEPLRHASSVHHLSRIIASLAHLIRSGHQQCNANASNNLSRHDNNMPRSSYLWPASKSQQNRNQPHHHTDIINTSTDSSSSSGQTTLEAATALESDIMQQQNNNSVMIDQHDSATASLRLNHQSTTNQQQQQQQQYGFGRNVVPRPTLHRQQHTTASSYLNDGLRLNTKHTTTTSGLIFNHDTSGNKQNFTTVTNTDITGQAATSLHHHNNHEAEIINSESSFDEMDHYERRRSTAIDDHTTERVIIDDDYGDDYDDDSLLLDNDDDFDEDDEEEAELALADENRPDIISEQYHHRHSTSSKQHAGNNDLRDSQTGARRRCRVPMDRSIYLKALNTLIELTQEFTDCAYTGHEHRENILIVNDCIKMQMSQLIRMISLLKRGFIQDRQVNLNQMRHLANQIIDSCNELKYELQTVAIEQSDELDRLNGQLNILKRLKHCCLGGDMERLARTSRDFLDHGEHLVEICKLLNQVVPTHKLKISTQTLINWFGNNSRQIINASDCLCMNSRSKIARDHLWAYLQVWSSFYEDFCQIARQLAYMARSYDNGSQQRQAGGQQLIREQLLMKRQLLLQQQQQYKYDALMGASAKQSLRHQLRAALYNEQQQQQQKLQQNSATANINSNNNSATVNNNNNIAGNGGRGLGTNSTSFHDLRSILCDQQQQQQQPINKLTGNHRDDSYLVSTRAAYNGAPLNIMGANELGSATCSEVVHRQQQQQLSYGNVGAATRDELMYCHSSAPEMDSHLMGDLAGGQAAPVGAAHQHPLGGTAHRNQPGVSYLDANAGPVPATGSLNLAQSHDFDGNNRMMMAPPPLPPPMRGATGGNNRLQQQPSGAVDGLITSGATARQVLPKSSLKQTGARVVGDHYDHQQTAASTNSNTNYPLMAAPYQQQQQPEMLQGAPRPMRERVVTINESASKVYHHTGDGGAHGHGYATAHQQLHLDEGEGNSSQQPQHHHQYNSELALQRHQPHIGQQQQQQQLLPGTRSNPARTAAALDGHINGPVPAPLTIAPVAAGASGGLTTPPGSVAGDSEQGGATDQQSSTTDADKWSDSEDNDIVQIARATAQMAYSMYQFTRGEGELNTTQDLFTQAELFAEESNELYKDVRRFSYDVPAGSLKKELLSNLDLIPTLVQQLQFTVKNPTVGKPATFTKVDNVIRETRALMEAVNKVVNSSIACRQHYNMGTQSMRKRSRTLSPSYRSDESFEFEAQSSARTGMNSRSAGGGTGSEPDI